MNFSFSVKWLLRGLQKNWTGKVEAPRLVNQYSQRSLYILEEIFGRATRFLTYLGIAANNYDELMFLGIPCCQLTG